jgi:hypothetical protein
MSFKSISIDDYVKQHLKINPTENKVDLIKRINAALKDYNNGIKCLCGNDIWVIGSASVGNGCFTCITGEAYPNDDYEIDISIKKRESAKGRKHINDIDPTKIAGFFDDDGYEVIPELIKKPSLCITCKHDGNPNEEILCTLTRMDQRNDNEFKCFGYEKG